MAFENYWKDLRKVTKTSTDDGTGGKTSQYVVSVTTFKGSAVKASTGTQLVAGVRNEIREQYIVATGKNINLIANDIITFKSEDNRDVYLKISSNAIYTPVHSRQNFKYFNATQFEPDLRVVSEEE